jgi:hypothetical protein
MSLLYSCDIVPTTAVGTFPLRLNSTSSSYTMEDAAAAASAADNGHPVQSISHSLSTKQNYYYGNASYQTEMSAESLYRSCYVSSSISVINVVTYEGFFYEAVKFVPQNCFKYG